MDREVSRDSGPIARKKRPECSNPKTRAQIETLITLAYATPEDIRKQLIDLYQLGPGAEDK